MKILFLDFDGVLNSKQEVIYHWRRKRTFWGRWQLWFMDKIFRVISSPFKPFQNSDTWIYRKTDGRSYRIWQTFFNWYLANWDVECTFCPISCSNVQYVLDNDPEVMIVVSSTWRAHGFEFCKKLLKRNGIDPKRVVGRTGGWEDGGNQRGDQIQGWLKRHHARVCDMPMPGPWSGVDVAPKEPVTAFVATDDDSDMDAVQEQFVKCRSQTGFTMFEAYATLRKLGTKGDRKDTLFDYYP